MVGGFTKLAFSFPSDTQVYLSCSLIFNNKMYVFGGSNLKRQISTVDGCGLKRIGSLNFDFERGACTTVQGTGTLLCFSNSKSSKTEGQECRVSSSPIGSFTKIKNSNYIHYQTKIASNGGLLWIKNFIETFYLDTVLAVASRDNRSQQGHNKAELYSTSAPVWKTMASYPYHEKFWDFEILAHSSSFFIFGGLYTDKAWTSYYKIDIIAKFSPVLNQWVKLGSFRNSRHAFGVTKTDQIFLIMGGYSSKPTEICELQNGAMNCASTQPTMNNFMYYPAMMTVSSDYANNCWLNPVVKLHD